MSQIRTLADFAITISSGTVSPTVLGSGTANSNTYLAGDNTWKTIQSGLLLQAVQSNNFTAVAGSSYPVNTANGAVTVTLPASPVPGQQVQIIDYAGTANANSITINPNGGKLNGSSPNAITTSIRASSTLVYIDAVQGWVDSSIGNAGYLMQSYSVSYLAIAGGGGGAGGNNSAGGGGGGAGGMLSGSLVLNRGIPVSVTVGSGGATGAQGTSGTGFSGSNSSIGNLAVAIGGGGGGNYVNGLSGGSGGGTSAIYTGGSGTGGQGYAGGNCITSRGASGGGGASAVGSSKGDEAYNVNSVGAGGGAGAVSSISGTLTAYAGGGGGGASNPGSSGGSGGSGGGGAGGSGSPTVGTAGTVNTGGGGGGGGSYTSANQNAAGASGGSGIVIISYPGSQIGTGGTVTSSGGYTIHTFTSSGTFTS